MKTGMINAILRVGTLGSRFLLSLYIAKLLSIRDVGIFALLTGVVGLLPSLTGFGLNYFVSRAIVQGGGDTIARMSRDRLLFSITLSGLVSVIIAYISSKGIIALPVSPLLLISIIILEVTSFDIQMLLLARRKSAFANLLLFLRSGAWVLPYIAASITLPSLRTINVVSIFWLGGLVTSNIVLIYYLRHRVTFALRDRRRTPMRSWPSSRQWPKIYMADIGLAGSIYLDRFIVTSVINVESAGVYFFFTSIINAVYIVCLASTTQVYAPDFRAAYTTGGLPELHKVIGHRMRETVAITFLMLGLALPATYGVAYIIHKPQLINNTQIIPIIVAAYCAKIVSEFMSAVIAAAERDSQYAIFNISSLILTMGMCVIGTWLLGLLGTACGLLAASCAVTALRFSAWRRLRGHSRSESVEFAG